MKNNSQYPGHPWRDKGSYRNAAKPVATAAWECVSVLPVEDPPDRHEIMSIATDLGYSERHGE